MSLRRTTIRLAIAPLCLAAGCGMQPAPSTDATPREAHVATLNGARLFYEIAGSASVPSDASPVIFLHGGPGYNSYSFAALVGPALERSARMVYLDQRGSGRSERPASHDYALPTLVQDVEALRRELGAPTITLLGHSFGGTLALEYAARYPEHVDRLILVDPMSDGPATYRHWRTRLAMVAPAALARAVADARAQRADSSDFAITMRVAGALGGRALFDPMQFRDSTVRRMMDSVDAHSALQNTGELSGSLFSNELPTYRFAGAARLTMPTLVIAGRDDHAIGIETVRALSAGLPCVRLLEYEGSAHFPFLEEPDRFVADVRAFLQRDGTSRRARC